MPESMKNEFILKILDYKDNTPVAEICIVDGHIRIDNEAAIIDAHDNRELLLTHSRKRFGSGYDLDEFAVTSQELKSLISDEVSWKILTERALYDGVLDRTLLYWFFAVDDKGEILSDRADEILSSSRDMVAAKFSYSCSHDHLDTIWGFNYENDYIAEVNLARDHAGRAYYIYGCESNHIYHSSNYKLESVDKLSMQDAVAASCINMANILDNDDEDIADYANRLLISLDDFGVYGSDKIDVFQSIVRLDKNRIISPYFEMQILKLNRRTGDTPCVGL